MTRDPDDSFFIDELARGELVARILDEERRAPMPRSSGFSLVVIEA